MIEPLVARPLEAGERKQGTSVRVWPDAKYFESSVLPMGEVSVSSPTCGLPRKSKLAEKDCGGSDSRVNPRRPLH